jgi:hypothetical protein
MQGDACVGRGCAVFVKGIKHKIRLFFEIFKKVHVGNRNWKATYFSPL